MFANLKISAVAQPLRVSLFGDKIKPYSNALIDMINKYNGAIFGSVAIALSLNRRRIVESYSSDIDVIFYDINDYNNFNKAMAAHFEQHEDKNLRYYQAVHYHRFYSFTELIPSGFDAPEEKGCSHRSNYFTIDAMYLDQKHLQVCKQSTEAFIDLMFNHFFTLHFTRALYFKNKLYSVLSEADNDIPIPIHLYEINRSQTAKQLMSKYIRRKVKFEIVDSTEETRINRRTLRQAKQKYQDLGLVVIPLSMKDKDGAGKAPAVANWQQKDTDYDFIVDRCDNIGIVCGPESGIVCIDVDRKDRGMCYFKKMIELYGLPKCPMQITPNGGWHCLFKFNRERMTNMDPKIKGVRINNMKIGIDFWIQHCQFVVEPSVNHAVNRPYKWIEPIKDIESIPEMPEWIYTLYHTEQIDYDGNILAMKEKEVKEEVKEEIIVESEYESSDSGFDSGDDESDSDVESYADTEEVDSIPQEADAPETTADAEVTIDIDQEDDSNATITEMNEWLDDNAKKMLLMLFLFIILMK